MNTFSPVKPRSVSTVLLAVDADARQIVSVHSKRTYAFDASGTCVRADEQVPLFIPRSDPRAPWHTEMDILPIKRSTDVIIHALAHANGSRSCEASIRVGPKTLSYRVTGRRQCLYQGPGSVSFSTPEPFDALPICYDNAYGGVDPTVEIERPASISDCFRRYPGEYPRNPIGRGYVINDRKEVLDGLELPNVEHPDQLLTPENIVVGPNKCWWRQPLPWSCDWFHKSWYPRSSFFGGPPLDMPHDDREIAEVLLGWVSADQHASAAKRADADFIDNRYFDAASPALVLPFIGPRERIALKGMTPDGNLILELPDESPAMSVRFAGREYDIEPRCNRVLISVEEQRLSIVWHGAWHPPIELPDRFPEADDEPWMDLQGVEAFVEGKLVAPHGAEP